MNEDEKPWQLVVPRNRKNKDNTVCVPRTQMGPLVLIRKGLVFWRVDLQNRGQLGSRYIIIIYTYRDLYLSVLIETYEFDTIYVIYIYIYMFCCCAFSTKKEGSQQ